MISTWVPDSLRALDCISTFLGHTSSTPNLWVSLLPKDQGAIRRRNLELLPRESKYPILTWTPQCTSIKGLMVSIRWYLGSLKG